MKVDEVTAQALRESIAHWERLTTGDRIDDEGIGGGYCALCQLYCGDRPSKDWCLGCPVTMWRGKPGCSNTPYGAAEDASYNPLNYDSPKFRRAAAAELRYLCELAGRLGVDLD